MLIETFSFTILGVVGAATDVAGEIVEVGPEVKDYKPGDKVVAILNHLVSRIFLFSYILIALLSLYPFLFCEVDVQ